MNQSIRGSRRRGSVISLLAIYAMAALAACGGGSTGGAGATDKGQVIVYDGGGPWGAAQRAAYFTPFEKQTGIKVITAPQPNPAQVRTEIEAGRPSIDVFNNDGSRLDAWMKAGLTEPIDYSQWPKGMIDDFKPYSTLPAGVPSLIFAVKMAYDPNVTKGDPTSWADFWNTKQFPGKRSLGDTASSLAAGTIEAALLADGVPADKLYPLDVDRAFRKLDELRPQILKFWGSGAESVQLLIDRQVGAVAAWDGRINDATSKGAKIESTWKQSILQVNYWMIPKGAPHTQNAQKFIEFASQPDRQAEFSKLITYAPGNSKAYDQIPADRQALLATAPNTLKQTIVANNEFWNSAAPSGKPWNVEIVSRWQAWLAKG